MPSISVSRSTAIVGVSLLVVVLVLAGQRLAGAGAAEPSSAAASTEAEVAPLEAVSAPGARTRLVVHVVGAVKRPGLYRLAEGARVADAVERAGGATAAANLAGLNLAAPLVDGTQVLVPAAVEMTNGGVPAESGAPEGTGDALLAPTQKVSLATATAEQLDELPGVGPITAQKILDHRTEHGPFRSVDDLDAVPGIGPARIEQLRDLVTP
jgi:competence protein ComEA